MTKYENFMEIIKEELVLAQGCTEPISGAYVASVAKDYADFDVKTIEISASQNIIKNARGVIIPNTENERGVESSVVLGYLNGDTKQSMRVLDKVTFSDVVKARRFIKDGHVTLEFADTPAKLYIKVTLKGHDDQYVSAEVMHNHTNITKIVKNDEVIKDEFCDPNDTHVGNSDRSIVTIDDIYDFVKEVSLDELDLVREQLRVNHQVALEGCVKIYGAQTAISVKKRLEKDGLIYDVKRRAAAMAAAGSDARMGGSTLPVMIISGSGNQGITVTLPNIVYANHLHTSQEKLIRAVLLSDLVAIHIKQQLGKLSPVCGVTVAAMGAMSGILYQQDAKLRQIKDAITNNIATIAGVICDGAKPSCALKIHTSIETSIMCGYLSLNGQVIEAKTGIIEADVEDTIKNFGRVATAMSAVDDAITEIMQGCND